MIAEPRVLKKPVTHTQSTPDGSVVVVTGVPATVVASPEGPDHISYSLDVAERLESIISDALTTSPGPRAQVFVSWNAGVTLPAYDLELRFRGPGTSFGSASIGFWEKMTTRVNSAFGIVARSLTRVHGVPASAPHVAFVGPGSLRIGLRSRQSEPLFDDVQTPEELGLRALRILAQAPMMVAEESQGDSHFGSNPGVAHAALRALEVLTPSPRNPHQSVDIIPSPTAFPQLRPSVLTAEMLPFIRATRKQLSSDAMQHEEIVLEGLIDKVTTDGLFHLRDIEVFEGEWGRATTAEVTFADVDFGEVVSYFRDRFRVRVYGLRTLGPDAMARRLKLQALDPATTGDEG